MRCQARPDSRVSVALSPINNILEALPIWFVHQVLSKRLSTRHNERIELCVSKGFGAGIEIADVPCACLTPGNASHRIERKADWDAVGSRIEKGNELPLRSLESSVRHVVHQSNCEVSRGPLLVSLSSLS